MLRKKENKPGLIIGVLLIILLIAYPFLDLGNKFSLWSFDIKKYKNILDSIFAIYFGILFILSYFFSHKSFFFRGIIWVCENFSHPKGRGMAFFYSALGIFLGTVNLINSFLFSGKNNTIGGSIMYSSVIVCIFGIVMIALSIKIIRENERLAIFRFGRFLGIRGPGLVLIIPFIDKGVKVNLRDNIPDWLNLSENELEEKVKILVLDKKQ